MFRNTPFATVPTFKLILGFGLCTLGGAMLYAYFKIRDDDNDENDGTQQKKLPSAISNNIQNQSKQPQQHQQQKQQQQQQQEKLKEKPEKEININFVISNEHIPLVVGRGGGNLNMIEEKTRTKIRFRDKDEGHKLCDITGIPDAVKEARSLLLKEIERSPIVKEEMLVPQSVCGKITGRCGEAMQEICRLSLAKVSIDSGNRNSNMDQRFLTITGNRQQVNLARKLIEDKIEEDEKLRRAVEEVEQRREPRRSPTNSLNSSMYSSQTSLSSHLPPREKLLAARADNKPMEVYVSAIASPSKFWVQLIGPQSKKLDDLVQTMTNYYNEKDNRNLHHISEPYLGQIVAAIFKYDGKWYRAEIVGIVPNQYKPKELVVDVYFVDYGDSQYVALDELYELRTDFLTLRFQAVECFLANIKSVATNEIDNWDTPSVQKFEEITQVANWKKLMSRVVTYKDRTKATNGSSSGQTSTGREGSPIPGVELYDNNEGFEVNIGDMLISQGYAVPIDDYRPRSPFFNITPESSMYQQNPLSPKSPQSLVSIESIPTSAEDSLMEQQLQHLQKNNNLYLNGGMSASNSPLQSSMKDTAKLSVDFVNGNYNATTMTAKTNEQIDLLNGNLSR